MQRARLAAVLAVSLVGTVLLAGCRSDPNVAAYVGDDKITEARIDEVLADFKEKLPTPSANPDGTPGQPAAVPTRRDVLNGLMYLSLCRKIQEEHKFASQPVDAKQIAESSGVPVDSIYAKTQADLASCVQGLPEGVKLDTSPPTDQEAQDLYEHLRALGIADAGLTPQGLKQVIEGNTGVLRYLAITRVLTGAADKANVSVNPRYRPLELPVFQDQGFDIIVAQVGQAGSGAVHSNPSPAPPQPAPAN